MNRAQELFADAFGVPREARSDAYRAGVLDTLRLRCPYPTGSAYAMAAAMLAEREK